MKNNQLRFLISMCFILAISCGEKKKTKSDNVSISEEKKVTDYVKEAKENISTKNKLEETTPITSEELDEWIPNKIAGLERTTYLTDINPKLEIFMAKAKYTTPSSKKSLDITFMDGAGERGSKAIGPYLNLENLYKDETTNQGFQKVISKNNMVIVQKYRKQGDKFILEFAPKDRYAIKIETESFSEEELWDAVDYFNFDKLKGI